MSTLVDQLLKKSEIKDLEKKQLDILTKFIPGGFVIQRADESCSFKYISEGFANMFGYTLEEFMEVSGGTMKGIAHVGNETGTITQIEDHLKDGDAYVNAPHTLFCMRSSILLGRANRALTPTLLFS